MKKSILSFLLFGAVCCNAAEIKDLGYEIKTSSNQFGSVMIKHSDNDGDSLLLNKQKINLGKEGNSFTLNMLSLINYPKASVYIILGGSGGTMDMDSNIACKFLTITGKNAYQVSALTYCPGNYKDAVQIKNNLIIVKYPNVAPYAESTDIGSLSYDYTRNKVEIITHLKRDSYYKKKFASYTPTQIYQEAAADGNIDKDTGLIASCHICGMYGYKYCFKFNALANPPHDKYYAILQKSCN